jgi:eukaryotic-like serine/threonine-protein kinase
VKTQVCPSVSDLASFRAGLLALDAHFSVAKHLKTCPICVRKVKNFAGPSIHASDDSVEESTINEDTSPDLAPLRTQLGPYALKQLIGRGGMGIVYEAEHVKLRNRVAVKVLPKSTLSDPAALERFRHEWEAVGRLSHPNVVRAMHAGEADGIPFLAMEYINGPDLARIVATHGPLGCADAAELVRQAALGLAHAHEQGVIHRDVKPNNLLITTEGQVKLLDLGLARLAGGDSIRTNQQFLGTADYMAPEQWQGQPTDARTDVYSLGCVLFFVLTGRPPFSSTSYPSTRSKMVAHTETLPPSVTAPTALNELLMRMLAKSPSDRVASAAEVAERISVFSVGANLRQLINGNGTVKDAAFLDGQQTRPLGEAKPPTPTTKPSAIRQFVARVRSWWK